MTREAILVNDTAMTTLGDRPAARGGRLKDLRRRLWLAWLGRRGRRRCWRGWRCRRWFLRCPVGRVYPVSGTMRRHPSTPPVVVPPNPMPTAGTSPIGYRRVWGYGYWCDVSIGRHRLDGHIHAGWQAEHQRGDQRARYDKRSHPVPRLLPRNDA